MISFDGVYYYIDMKAIDDLIGGHPSLKDQELEESETKEFFDKDGNKTGHEVVTRKYHKGKEVDGARFEIINSMLQMVLIDGEPMDDTLGSERAFDSKPLNYKIAFNTLRKWGILKAVEA